MSSAVRFVPEPQRELAFTGITTSYANIGTSLTSATRMYELWNLTDADLQFSYDGGRTNHFVLPTRAGKVYDVSTNRDANGEAFYLPKGTQFAVKRIGTATTGSVYLSVAHAIGE